MKTQQRMIPLSMPEISGNEARYVQECIASGWVSSAGPYVPRFEEAFAKRLGVRQALATASGTAAIHAALRVVGVGPDDEVLVPAMTFIASANPIVYQGAVPRIMDVEPEFGTLDPAPVARLLARASWDAARAAPIDPDTGRAIRAIVVVHVYGYAARMQPILDMAARHQIAVVEDATEGLGALIEGRPVGTIGDIGCFSFNGNKLMTTGSGGLLVSRRDDRLARARYLITQARDHAVEYEHHDVGWNYRLSSLQAAFGLAQLERLDEFLAKKARFARIYERGLAGVPGVTALREVPGTQSSYWLFTIRVDPETYGMNSRTLMTRLLERGIETRPLFRPLSRQRAFERWCADQTCPVADDFWQNGLNLPGSVGSSDEDIEFVARTIRECAAEPR